ncbi:hypothetical protein [Streptomyces sp. NBC_01012]|uniref:hypothetical protein n=1 Tax=Streptomyces sp. NBC_01012 TaxID=2903717 RepID=UPI0038642D81|nr:hypothetical protein OG623_32130 [Streptomyces sp. NBC_01012]
MTRKPADAWPRQRYPDLSELGPLVRHADRRTRHQGLTLLADRAASPRLPAGEAAEPAGLLPHDVWRSRYPDVLERLTASEGGAPPLP